MNELTRLTRCEWPANVEQFQITPQTPGEEPIRLRCISREEDARTRGDGTVEVIPTIYMLDDGTRRGFIMQHVEVVGVDTTDKPVITTHDDQYFLIPNPDDYLKAWWLGELRPTSMERGAA